MLKFKAGDTVWYWDTGECIHPFSLEDISVQETVVTAIDTERSEYIIEDSLSIHVLSKNIYGSKNEAIQAMYSHLANIKNYDECHHVFQKTLAKSGMYFISMCHKCGYFKGYDPDE